MQSSAANEHLQLCKAHLCLLNSSNARIWHRQQLTARLLLLLRGLCAVTHAVNQGLSVCFVLTVSYDQLEANPQLIYSQQAESKPALAI